MALTDLPIQQQASRRFFFRGYAVAAGGFLTRIGSQPVPLDPSQVTTHGESSLPLIGGVSHSVVRAPELTFPNNIRYGACETFVEGRYDGTQTITTLRATVNDVRLTTGPSPDDNIPNVRAMSFSAGSMALQGESVYPQTGPSTFTIHPSQPTDMALVITDSHGMDTRLPITLEFDQRTLCLPSIHELDDLFRSDRQFFDRTLRCYCGPKKPEFEEKSLIPRTPRGFIVTSFVRQIRLGDSEPIPGNVLNKKGFGVIQFGLMLINPFGRRFVMAHIRMGSSPGGEADFCAVEDTGDWGN